MDDFFDKLGGTVVSVSKEARDKAFEAAGIAKLRMEIRNRESYLNELYAELGRKYYVEHKGEGDIDFIEIDNLAEEIDELRAELDAKRGAAKCPHCGAFVDKNAVYCPKCGYKITEEKAEDTEEPEEESEPAQAEENPDPKEAEDSGEVETENKTENTEE